MVPNGSMGQAKALSAAARLLSHRFGNGMTIRTMTLIDAIGYIAATLTTASFVPQAWHTFQTKDVKGISLAMYSAFTLGVTLWLVYGVLLSAWPIVVANVITLALAVAILRMKLTYGKSRTPERRS